MIDADDARTILNLMDKAVHLTHDERELAARLLEYFGLTSEFEGILEPKK